ncbi:MAG: hypothetical protein V7723_03950 [Sneathiella sp.]
MGAFDGACDAYSEKDLRRSIGGMMAQSKENGWLAGTYANKLT